DGLVEGNPANPVSTAAAFPTGHAFLDDIAHTAVPVDAQGQSIPYNSELLDNHFITGDGRGNENIGLTAVHHVFHSGHNRQMAEIQHTLLEGGDLALLNSFLLNPLDTFP